MKKLFQQIINKRLIFLSLCAFAAFSTFAISKSLKSGNIKIDPKIQDDFANMTYLILENNCKITILMSPKTAPNHVARIKELMKEKYFNGVVFHRVINGFMAQAGGKNGDLNASTGVKIKAEFSNSKHSRGTVSMARAQDPDSADSQFFIVTEDSPFLDGQYSVWGKVIDGMPCVDAIPEGNPNNNGIVSNPIKIKTMILAQDYEISMLNSKK